MLPAIADYTPFLNSLQALWPNISAYWLWSIIPLVIAICIVYKGTKLDDLRQLPWAACKLTIIVLFVMVLGAAGLYGLVYAVHH